MAEIWSAPYYRARYYDPSTGRFDSEDPLVFAGADDDFYDYVWEQPTSYRDPSGWWGVGFIGSVGGGFGLSPAMGAGSVSGEKQPELLEAGSAVSAILVRGDMDIAATCTVTYIDPQRLLACGHPLLQFGSVNCLEMAQEFGCGCRRLTIRGTQSVKRM